MPTTMPARYSCLVVFSVLMVLGGCGVPCQRCGKEGHVAPTTPSRAVQELLAHRTWAAFVEGRAAHEERAMQVAAIEADHDRVAHLPRVSLRVGTPIPLATAMQMLVAETGYSVVYEVGVDPQHPVSSLLVHQRLDAATDALVQPLGYTARLHTRDRQIHITSLMTGRWRLSGRENDEAWWTAVRTLLDEAITLDAQTATMSSSSAPMTHTHGTVLMDRVSGMVAVSAPVPRFGVIDAYLSGLGAERIETHEE